jgi:hypothetical protein
MKYVANPVEVDAFKIVKVHVLDGGGVFGNRRERFSLELSEPLDHSTAFLPSEEMLSRITPIEGDYVVVQSDGYIYLNPKEVFERKYSKKENR